MKVTVLVLALLATFLGISTNVQAQSTDTHQKSAEERKGEVDVLLKEMREHNEPVVKSCLENCKESDLQGGNVTVGEAINKVQPVYPPIARAAHATGEVVVMVIIDEEGKVIAAQAVSGHPLLQAASVKAARESTFNPTRIDGKPVKVTGTIAYNFLLN